MQTLVLRFLLGRGIGPIQEMLSKAVRHGMTTLGGAMVAADAITQDEVGVLQGAAVILVGAGLSFARTFLSKFIS